MSKESTVTDAPVSDDGFITEEEASKFDLDPHLVNLLLHEPFFSTFMRKVIKVKTNSIPTAGIMCRDTNLTMLWNPRFVGSLKSIQVRGLLKHEMYHAIYLHVTSRKQEPHMLWNWATDLAINGLLDRKELPDGGLYPGESLDLSKVTDPALKEKWQKVSDLIASFPKGKASEWYMEMLQKDKDASDTISGKGEGAPVFLDDHDGWGDLSDEEKQVMTGKIKQALSDSVKKCDRTGQWGSVSSNQRSQLREMVSNAINWKSILFNFIGRSQRMNKSRTMKKINRKYPYIHAGTRRGHSANLAVYIDQSGSVADEDLELFFGTLNQLGRLTAFKLFPFDYSVDDDNAVSWRRGQKVPPQRVKSGGTSFHAVAQHFDKHGSEFDGYIVLTDGEASDPGPSRKRRCWVLLPGTKLYFNSHPGDVVVEMRQPAN